MKYTKLKGYDYRAYEDETIQTGFTIDLLRHTAPGIYDHPFFTINASGIITVKKGYAWDGASWCPDFRWIIRGSKFHDVGYQCGRMDVIPDTYRIKFDELLRKMCIEDKAWKWQADVVYNAVRIGASAAWTSKDNVEILEAP